MVYVIIFPRGDDSGVGLKSDHLDEIGSAGGAAGAWKIIWLLTSSHKSALRVWHFCFITHSDCY